MKKTILSFCLLFLGTLSLLAQDRENKKPLAFSQSSDTLKAATGWANNEHLGEWMEHPNYISIEKGAKYSGLKGFDESLGLQNFTYLVAKKITANNKNYVALIVSYWVGHYDYPAIKKDYKTSVAKTAYIFEENEYNKLANIKKEVSLKVKFVAHKNATDDEDGFMGSIKSVLDGKTFSNNTFPAMKATNGSIRFFLPDYHSKYSDLQFEKNYFEVSENDFKKLIIK